MTTGPSMGPHSSEQGNLLSSALNIPSLDSFNGASLFRARKLGTMLGEKPGSEISVLQWGLTLPSKETADVDAGENRPSHHALQWGLTLPSKETAIMRPR